MMIRRVVSSLAFGALCAVAVSAALEREARACGGCFAPPQDNTIVTDHRMVLSLSAQQTTLYDQIRYRGSPESFAWVLPIRGEALVGVSADGLFNALDARTKVQVVPPPRNCPPRPTSCDTESYAPQAAGGGSSSGGSNGRGDVTVLRQETVGPYETVQLRSTDPEALTKWLTEKGYRIGPDIAPVVAAYVSDGFDFLALKLVPGKNVQAMKPVRITTRGATPSLPLRMIAAGTGAAVGIGLWVVGDGRWEPQNFKSFLIKQEELVWTWSTFSSNLTSLRAEKNGALGGSAWEVETSIAQPSAQLRKDIVSGLEFDPQTMSNIIASEYPPTLDAKGNLTRTSASLLEEDLGFLLTNKASLRVTRMRADLPQASLAADLVLQASADQGELLQSRVVTRESDQPLCPVYDSECRVLGQAPRDQAWTRSAGNTGVGCAVGKPAGPSGTGALLAVAGVGLALFAARRRARKG